MANIFQKMFGFQPKRDITYRGPKPKAISEFPSYQSARDLLGTYGTPESYRDVYHRDLYQPTAKAARYGFEQYTKPEIYGSEAAMGFGRSSRALDALTRAKTEQEMELAKYGGELRARGYETGLGERAKQLGGYQALLPQERGQEAQQVAFDYKDYLNQIKKATARRKANQEAMGRAISFGTDIVSPFLPGGGAMDWLRRLRTPRTAIAGGAGMGRGIGAGAGF